ncbi:telomerase-binding protein EST1A [Erpetoichthys calabaricus]|uniref:Telomerase-binding protein EST1A n=1 Tax=Erpetoichthys calabaricus TaxID=27687 RepID=A0A8C4S8D0_ERPCA|nr:telomerase-binding protein EST1A [Erpetoichthys calabaricus]
MAEQLERVRISAAELRGSPSVGNEERTDTAKSCAERRLRQDRKRPDLQLYQPGLSRLRQRRETSGSSEGDAIHVEDLSKEQESVGNTPVIENSSTSVLENDFAYQKQTRRNRKPDRQIYQPSGRRLQQTSSTNKLVTASDDVKVNEHTVIEKEIKAENMILQEPSPIKVPDSKNNVKGSKKCESVRTLVKEAQTLSISEDNQLILRKGKHGKHLVESCEEKRQNKHDNRRHVIVPKDEIKDVGRKKSEKDNKGSEIQKESGRMFETDEVTHPNKNEDYQHFPVKTNASSKRYSRSDKRRNHNRTCSTSSDSSGTSFDGLANGSGSTATGEKRKKPHTQSYSEVFRSRDQEKSRGYREKASVSSTDSLEEFVGREQKDYSLERHSNNRMRRKNNDDKESGVLKIALERGSGLHSVNSSCLLKKSLSSKGKGGGILVLPVHTDLTVSVNPGSRLIGTRGSRERGRGGATRRLWDPNNPDEKPALSQVGHCYSLQQQQALHSQQQLHFLDTDDETTGSPPSQQGDVFQNFSSTQQTMSAVTSGNYKFQNSDNPYYYQPGVPRYPYHYLPYGVPGTNGLYPSTPPSYYPGYLHLSLQQGYLPTPVSPEEAEVQARGLQQQELGKLLRLADNQEVQLSNLLSRDRLSTEGLERMSQIRAELLALYEKVILSDIEYSDAQNLDQILWKNIFYQVIEKFRQLLKDPASDTNQQIREMLLHVLDEGAMFFDSLLKKLQATFQFKLDDYMDGMAIRSRPLRKTVKFALISAQRCMICLGDIARYREQTSDTANYGKARSWYLKAQQIAPKNGRPYNQLALLAVYTKRKLDAVYYYMRSLAASNPILTAKESLMSLFEETKRKADQLERRRQQQVLQDREEVSGFKLGLWSRGSGGSGVRSSLGHFGDETARVEIWVRPKGRRKSQSTKGVECTRELEQDKDFGYLTPSELNKRFILNFLHAHGKLFTKIGMESFPTVASQVLQEFYALLRQSPCPIGSTRMLQLTTINMFAVHNSQNRDDSCENRSLIHEQSIALGLAMFALLVERCTELLRETRKASTTTGNENYIEEDDGDIKVSSFIPDLRELLPSVKVWSDWMLGHPGQWNPPPCSLVLPHGWTLNVWQTLAEFCNILTGVNQCEVPLYKDSDDDLCLLILDEDRLLSGFIPLLGAPQDPCYVEKTSDKIIAADCKRVTVLKYFLEALCGQEEPLLAFKGGKYVSMAAVPDTMGKETGSREEKQTDNQEDDVLIEALEESSEPDASGSEDDLRELRARKNALTRKVAEQRRRHDKIQEVLQTCRQLEIEITPVFLVPDTNGFIDHLSGLATLLSCGHYILVVPLVVITELDGLVKGQETEYRTGSHARQVQERARKAVHFLESKFEAREPCLRALTSRGNELESISFRSEDTSGQQGNNDDLILSCCLHYCKDKAKDFMPTQKDEPIRLHREVVLLTDDRNLRVKALTRNVPVRDIPAFLKWAKVG